MSKYKLGVIPDAVRDTEDFENAVLTVWSMDAYNSHLRRGMPKQWSAMNAWRRVDLITLRSCSLLDRVDLPIDVSDSLPPDIVGGYHNLSNQYRLNNLPRTPLLVHP
jgi:hypothetical protein